MEPTLEALPETCYAGVRLESEHVRVTEVRVHGERAEVVMVVRVSIGAVTSMTGLGVREDGMWRVSELTVCELVEWVGSCVLSSQ
ncbi:MAG: hypothetical protein ACRDWD_11380 [Acidimicrobiia bacterium]